MKILEVKTIEKHGIAVKVEINYEKGTISLVDEHDQYGKYHKKDWVFYGRTIDYMPSWLHIMDAMMNAVRFATKELQMYQEGKTAEEEALMFAIFQEEERQRMESEKKGKKTKK